MTNGTSPAGNRDSQITHWWQEVEASVRRSQTARARRFLRWIVSCQPDEEEAWLALAHLASGPEERLQYLHRAYAFHPGSVRVITRLCEARTAFLESNVGDLIRPHHFIRCLPDERRRPHSTNGASRNGNHPHPLDELGRTPNLLTRLLQVIVNLQ